MNCWLLLRRRGEGLWFSEGLYDIWAIVSIRKVFIICRFVRVVWWADICGLYANIFGIE